MPETPLPDFGQRIARLHYFERRLREGFERMDHRFVTVGARLDRVDQRFDHIDTRLDELARQLGNGFTVVLSASRDTADTHSNHGDS